MLGRAVASRRRCELGRAARRRGELGRAASRTGELSRAVARRRGEAAWPSDERRILDDPERRFGRLWGRKGTSVSY